MGDFIQPRCFRHIEENLGLTETTHEDSLSFEVVLAKGTGFKIGLCLEHVPIINPRPHSSYLITPLDL
jgi:hypothetical protein